MTMRYVLLVVVIGLIAVRVTLRWRRRRGATPDAERRVRPTVRGPVVLVAEREIVQRVRGRLLKVTTLIILLVVAAAIVIPSLRSPSVRRVAVGVLGTPTTAIRQSAAKAAAGTGTKVTIGSTANLTAMHNELRSGVFDVGVDGDHLLVTTTLAPTDSSARAQFVRAFSSYYGFALAMQEAKLTSSQTSIVTGAQPATVVSLSPQTPRPGPDPIALLGLILTFVMLSQYNGWVLTGVMEEKTSRVVEVLLSAVRPIEMITGKVIGIGVVALSQAALIVAFALVLAQAVGSSLLSGSSPWIIVSSALWLILGYVFYSWVYAAAGAMVDRQDRAQAVAFPLSLPLIAAYVYSISEAAAQSTSVVFKAFAYFPPTAPFAMPTLVGLHEVTWWQFALSVAIDLAGTVVIARFAANVYRRAILRTGSKIRWRTVLRRA